MNRRYSPDSRLDLARAGPGLVDLARLMWQRKYFVVLGLAMGLALGVYAPPTVAAEPTYRATIRIDMKPLASTTLLASALSVTDAGRTTATGVAPPSPLQDVNTGATVLRELGATARRLAVVSGVPKGQWAGALAGAIVPTSLPGSTQVDLSYTDRDAKLAAMVVHRYAKTFSARRNAVDAALTRKALGAAQRRLDGMNRKIVSLSARADRETNPILRRGVSTATSTQLNLAIARWRAQADAYDAWTSQMLLLGPRTTVLTPAVVTQASRPVPGWVHVALGLLIGLMAGVGTALIVGAAHPKIVTVDDLERATRLTPVGSVPTAGFRRRRPLTVLEVPFSPAAEGYRNLAAQLERRGLGDDIKVLAIVSPDSREGRSTLTANLAYALARHRHVIIISGNLSKPDVERILGIRRGYTGLAELLEGHDHEVAALLIPAFHNLFLLPAGIATRNPAELLASARLPKTIASLRDPGLLILIDTPPARSLADALHLANCADAVVLVARSGNSRVRSLEAVAAGFESTGHRVVGAVLVDRRTSVISHHKTRRRGHRRSLDKLLLGTGLLKRRSSAVQAERSKTGTGDDEPREQRDEELEVVRVSSTDGPA
jgi:capsular exopolysaccharide synthesis family protein